MKFFPAYSRFSAGVQAFVPEAPDAYAQGAACKGFGIIRYGEGSVYYGDVYFDGYSYHKLGFGRQDFMLSEIGGFDSERKVRRAFYIGRFDYRETDWIYGNGAVFYVDADNKPACFVKGFYEGLDITGEYQGPFDASNLPDGYTMDMEAHFDYWGDVLRRQLKALPGVKKLENLFIGDSYFELWNDPAYAGKTFYETFDSRNNLNIGIGGTCFFSWPRFMQDIEALPTPKRVFLNLGFNDLHRHKNPDRAFADYKCLLTQLKTIFPHAEYYLLNVVQCPNDLDKEQIEDQFNAMTMDTAGDFGIKVLDMRQAVRAVGGVETAFAADRVHLNAVGYSAMSQIIEGIINNKREC